MFEDLKGKRILITGASSGIGACTAELLGQYGAVLGLHYRTATAVDTKKNIFTGDLLNAITRRDLIKLFVHTFGGIDVLVNNAGGIYGSDFLELDERAWDATFTLNTKVPFFLARDAFKVMREQERGGKIINISSISAKYGGSATTMHYGAAKAALDAITKGLAKAGAPYGILVNSIRGGLINTPFHAKIGRSPQVVEERIKLIPLKRIGQPVDIARMVLFLASEAGDYITGEVFTVAGGD